MKLQKKIFYRLLIITAFGIILISYFYYYGFRKDNPVFSHESPKGQNVIVAIGSEPRTLDPRRATDATGMRIVDLLFHSLVRLVPGLEILPYAAQKWTYNNKTYTFSISKKLKFSNGRTLNKEDLLFSFKEYRFGKSPFSSAFDIIVSVDVEERKENFILKIKLKKPSAKFLSSDLPVLKILPKEEVLSAGSDFQKKPIGTGPFQLKKRSSTQIVLAARSDVEPSPKIKEVTFKIIRDDYTRFQKMLNGEIDIMQSEISFQKVGYFSGKPDRFQIFRKPGTSMTYLLINFNDSCLANKEMREFLALSIDRLPLIKHKLKGFARPAVTILNPNNFFFNSRINNIPYNLKKSKTIFNRLSKFCRQRYFSFKTSHARSAIDHGKVLSLQLKQAGLKVKMESFEWGTFYGDLNAGRFQLALLKWVGAIDPDIYRLAFHSREHPPKGRNRSFYQNTVLDKLLDKGISLMDQEKRRFIYHQVQKIVREDIVFIPLWHEDQITVAQKSILNYDLSDNGDFFYLMKITKAH